MKSISDKLGSQIIEWTDEVAKTGKLLKLTEKLVNAYSVSGGQNPLGFEMYENYQHRFVVVCLPHKSMKEMSKLENKLSEEIRSIEYHKDILDRIKVFMTSLEEDVQECSYVENDGIRLKIIFK